MCQYIHVCIQLPIYTRYILTDCRWCLKAIRGAPDNDNRVNTEIHSGAVIELVWRYTLGGANRGYLEIHLEAIIERV